MTYLQLAKIAYEDYAATTNWKNYQGLQMPEFDDLPDGVKNAWKAAVAGVAAHVLDNSEQAAEMLQNEIVPQSTIL